MLLFQIVLLALVQGLGEFLPIGGAGPSTLVPASAGLPDQGLALGLAAHLGTLAAALLYFWRDGCRMTVGVFRLLFGRGPFEHPEAGARLALQLLAATVPAIALGAAIAHALGGALDSIPALAGVTILGGLLLVLADRTGATFRRVEDMKLRHALIIGTAEMLAVIPGAGRTTLAIAAARLLGYERPEAARAGVLLSIPALVVVAAVEAHRLIQLIGAGAPELHAVAPRDLVSTALVALLSGLAAIAFLMKLLERAGFMLFLVYRVLYAGALLYLLYGL
ncbi:MAG TPA: undecaprenyl-diphosphate phosphatase [Dongiaceae bacterium]|nr:undecaprenyl-diphosphate phosphatase [Dongiaceae bacterium]